MTDAMSRSESSQSSPSPDRRPLNIRLILGILAAVVVVLVIVMASGPAEKPDKKEASKAGPGAQPKVDVEATVAYAAIKSRLEESRDALKKGNLLQAFDLQATAEDEVKTVVQKWPTEQDIQGLPLQVEEIVFQFEKYGAADPPKPGLAANKDRYPDDTAGPDADQVNDLFVAAWASEKRNQPEAAIGIYTQALDRLDGLLKSGSYRSSAPMAADARHSEVPVPPQSAARGAAALLKKYYAVTSRLADLELRAGREDRAETARRRALAAIDQALARGTETAELSIELDSLLSDLARRERLSGRLESARLTLQRRLGLRQYLLTHVNAGPADPAESGATANTPAPDTGLGSAQLPPTVAAAGTDEPEPGIDNRSSHDIIIELAWLDRHTFHYDEGLEYLAELLDAALRSGQTAMTEADRQARLIRGEMLMDLGHFPEAELALKNALPYLNRLLDSPQPSLVGRVDIEPRVTTIRANLAIAELRLTQADLVQAEQYMEEALSLYRTLPGGHPVTFDVQLTRVKVLARKGDSQRAERELSGFLADSSKLLESPGVDIWVKRQILALMAEAAWQARARGEADLAINHYRRVNDELTPYITGIEVDNAAEYGSLFRPILVEIMEGEGDLLADLKRMSQAESRYVLGLDMARALRDQEPRQYFWRTRFDSLAAKVEKFHF